MLNLVCSALIGIVAMAWIFDVLRKLPSDLLAWTYGLIIYGIYLFLAVVVCGYDEVVTFLSPAPLFVAMAVTQATRSRLKSQVIRKPARDDSLVRMTREFREAMKELEAEREAREAAELKNMSTELKWLRRARTNRQPPEPVNEQVDRREAPSPRAGKSAATPAE